MEVHSRYHQAKLTSGLTLYKKTLRGIHNIRKEKQLFVKIDRELFEVFIDRYLRHTPYDETMSVHQTFKYEFQI